MEAFDLTLNQVNYEAEEHDLSEEQTLHSFSNLVAFDSDFKSSGNDDEGPPLLARKFKPSKQVSESQRIRSQSSLAELADLRGSGQDAAPAPTGAVGESEDNMDKSVAFEPSKDSFKAFTMTVEALALQRSVIGGSSVTPASAEEVARAIQEAQQKLHVQNTSRADAPDGRKHRKSPAKAVSMVTETVENSEAYAVVEHHEMSTHTIASSVAVREHTEFTAAGQGHEGPSSNGGIVPEIHTQKSLEAYYAHKQAIQNKINEVTVHRHGGGDKDAHMPVNTNSLQTSPQTASGDTADTNSLQTSPQTASGDTADTKSPPCSTPVHNSTAGAKPKRVKFEDDVVQDELSVKLTSEKAPVISDFPKANSPATSDSKGEEGHADHVPELSSADTTMEVGSSAKAFTRKPSFETNSDISYATNTDMSNFGSVQSTPRHEVAKQELVRIQPDGLSKVTARTPRFSGERIKSEDIRPAILPPHAQSLVLPPANTDDLCKRKRVEQWLYSEGYQGGKEERRSKKSSPKRKKKDRLAESSGSSSPASTKPSSDSTPVGSVPEVDAVLSVTTSEINGTPSGHIIQEHETAERDSIRNLDNLNLVQSQNQSSYVEECDSLSMNQKSYTSEVVTSTVDSICVNQSVDVQKTVQEVHTKVTQNVSESVKVTMVSEEQSVMHKESPSDSPRMPSVQPVIPANSSVIDSTEAEPAVTKCDLENTNDFEKPTEVPCNPVDTETNTGTRTENTEVIAIHRSEAHPITGAESPNLTYNGSSGLAIDAVITEGVSVTESETGSEVMSQDSMLHNQSHIHQDPVQTSTPIKPVHQLQNQSKTKKEKKKTKQYFMNQAKQVEAELDNDEWSTKIGENELGVSGDAHKRPGSQSSSRQSSVEKTSSHSKSAIKAELAKVLREKAKLEGQLEVVEKEAKTAIQERAKLQAQVAAKNMQLKSQDATRLSLEDGQRSLKADMQGLQDQRGRLEQVIVDAQKLLEEKDMEIKGLQEDLGTAHQANDKLQGKVKDTQQQVIAKETNAQALKGKIAELYVEFQTTNQAKILGEGEIKSLQSEIKSMANQRDWYQEQLKSAQEGKSDLQKHISQIQTENIKQTTLIERLKVDNMRIKHMLSDSQHKALQEKEMLARHLETIEADMMEREAAYTQLKQHRENMEKMIQSEEESDSQSQALADLQEELQKLKNDMRRKDASIYMLEHERNELVKRLTLSQESILERDKSIDTMEKKCLDLEISNQKIEKDLRLKDEECRKIRDLKNAIEIELYSARDEKKTFDDTLRTIKFDMGKVVKNFLQMKQDMSGKSEELEQTLKENNELKMKLEDLKVQYEKEQRDLEHERRASEVGSVKITTDGVTRLHAPMVNAEIMAERLQKSEPSELQRWKQIEEENTAIKSENKKIGEELKYSKEKLLELEVKVRTLVNEKTKMEGDLDNIRTDGDAMSDMQRENLRLREQIAQLQMESNQQISLHKDQAVKLGKDLENLQQDLHQRQLAYEQSLADCKRTITCMQEARSQLQGHTPISNADLNNGNVSDDTQEEKEDNSTDTHSSKFKVLSVEEANMKMQAEMSRAVEYIESKYRKQELQLQQKLSEESQRANCAEESSQQFEEKLKHIQNQLKSDLETSQEQMRAEYLTKEQDILNQLNEQKKKVGISEERCAVLKGELEEMMLRLSENSPQQMGEVVEKLAEERKLRAELEEQLSSLRHELESHMKESQHFTAPNESLNVSKDSEIQVEILSKESDVQVGTSSKDSEVQVEILSKDSEVQVETLSKDSEVQVETLSKDSEVQVETLSQSEVSIEEVNQRMQDEMTRAINHIESQFKIRENQLLLTIEEERKRIASSEEKLSNFELEVKKDIVKLKEEYENEKSSLTDNLHLMTKKAQIAEESGKIMKEEMDKLMLRFTETEQPQVAEVVEKLAAETEMRIKLETELEAVKGANNDIAAKEVGELKEHMRQITEDKVVLEKKLMDSEKMVCEQKLEHLMQRLLTHEERLDLDTRLGSGDQCGSQEALVIKLAMLADELYRMEGGRERVEQLRHTVPDTTANVPFLLDDVLQQMQVLEREKQDLQAEIKRLIKAQGDERLPGSISNQQASDPPPNLDKQVDIFMNRDDDTDANTCDSEPARAVHHVTYSKHITELVQKLDISVDIRQRVEKELHVIVHRASAEREALLLQQLAEVTEKLRTMAEQQGHTEQGIQPQHDPEIIEQLSQKLRLLQGEYADLLDTHQTASENAAKEVESLRQQYQEASRKLAETEAVLKERDGNSNLALDLEREKGRLAGVMKTHASLKEHTSVLELTLAQRESSVVEMSSHVQEELIRKERRCKDLTEKVEKLTKTIADEKQSAKDAKKALLTEKGKQVKLRRQMEEMWVEQDRLRTELQEKDNSITKVNLDLEKTREAEITARLDAERMRADCQGNKLEVERLRRELKDKKAKDPILQEQLQTLHWTLTQKEAELEASQERMQIAENRQAMEVENLQRAVQTHNSEISALREELTVIKKERSKLQARVAELKGALESSLAQAKMMKSQRRAQKEMLDKELANTVPPLPFDMAGLEKLLQESTAPSTVNSKPLSFLQTTLSGLRGEISTLQQQVDEHVGDVQHSSEAWKELEAQVQDLRNLCQVSASNRDPEQGRQVAIVTKNIEPLTTVTSAPPQ